SPASVTVNVPSGLDNARFTLPPGANGWPPGSAPVSVNRHRRTSPRALLIVSPATVRNSPCALNRTCSTGSGRRSAGPTPSPEAASHPRAVRSPCPVTSHFPSGLDAAVSGKFGEFLAQSSFPAATSQVCTPTQAPITVRRVPSGLQAVLYAWPFV